MRKFLGYMTNILMIGLAAEKTKTKSLYHIIYGITEIPKMGEK
jgi:hypothetical protein